MGRLLIWHLKDLCEVIEGCINNKFDAIVFVEGNRGCIFYDTKIFTPEGIKQVKDIPETSIIKAFDFDKGEEVNAIAKKISRKVQKVYEITTEDNRKIKATYNHTFILSNKRKVQLKNLKIGDELLSINKPAKIFSIEEAGKGKVYDFKVPKYENFILGNGIVVKNSGKSSLSFKICTRLKVPMPFRPKRDIVFSREDTLKHLASKKGGIIFSDELINVAYLRDFFLDEQKTLLKALNMYRDSCNVFIGCIPKFVELDKQMQRLCKIRITIVRRGIALIQTQMPAIYTPDGWDVKNNLKIESKWSSMGGRKPQYGKLTTIRGIMKFDDLSEKQKIEYAAIKEEKRSHVFGKYMDITLFANPEKKFYTNLLEQVKAGSVTPTTFETICSINGKEIGLVRTNLNKLLKEQGEELKLKDYLKKPADIEKKRKLDFALTSANKMLAIPTLEEPEPVSTQIKPIPKANIPIIKGSFLTPSTETEVPDEFFEEAEIKEPALSSSFEETKDYDEPEMKVDTDKLNKILKMKF